MSEEEKLSALLKIVELDQDLMDLLPKYVSNVRKDSDKLADFIKCKDVKEIEMITHRIKGSALSYGFEAIDMIAKNIEHYSKIKDFTSITKQKDMLVDYLLKVDKVLKSGESGD